MLLTAALSPAYGAGTHLMQPTIGSHVVLVGGYMEGGSEAMPYAGRLRGYLVEKGES